MWRIQSKFEITIFAIMHPCFFTFGNARLLMFFRRLKKTLSTFFCKQMHRSNEAPSSAVEKTGEASPTPAPQPAPAVEQSPVQKNKEEVPPTYVVIKTFEMQLTQLTVKLLLLLPSTLLFQSQLFFWIRWFYHQMNINLISHSQWHGSNLYSRCFVF